MQAYRIRSWRGAAELCEVPVPVPGPGQVLMKVAGCGLCHSDLGMIGIPAEFGEPLGWSMPFTLGHETTGWIAGIGPHTELGLDEGDAVALVAAASCGHCRYCITGQDNACPGGSAGRGYGRDGGLAEYVLVEDPRDLLPLGGLDAVTAGPLTDAGSTSYHAVRRVRSRLLPGATAVILGAGGLGRFAVQYVRLFGAARTIVVDHAENRRAQALELGADEAIHGVDEHTAVRIRELTGSAGADVVLDFVGTDGSIAAGLGALAAGGAFGLVGAGGGGFGGNWFSGLPRDGEVFTFQGSDIADTRAVIELARTGAISNPTEVFALADIEDAYRRLESGQLIGRVVAVP